MRCPKCGFTGFDHLDDCSKCGHDLTAFKSRFNLRAPLFAAAVPLLSPAPPQRKAPIADSPVAIAEATDFGYDFTADEVPSASSPPPGKEETPDDGFRFDEAGEAFGAAAEGAFALESTPASFSAPGEDGEGGAGDEFLDLELDLSWDEKPTGTDGMTADPAPPFEEDSFELPSLDELPPLESNLPPEDDFLDDGFPDELEDLPDFPGEEPSGEKRENSQGEPRDPFDLRGVVPTQRPPVNSQTASASPSPLQDAPAGESPSRTPLARRLGATLTDFLLLAAGFALFVVAGEVVVSPGEGRLLPSSGEMADLRVPYLFVLFFLCFSYSTLFHYLLGQTVGKMIFRLQVVGNDGDPLPLSRAVARSAGGFLSLLCAGAGYLPLLRGQPCWSDRLAGTRVQRHEAVAAFSMESA